MNEHQCAAFVTGGGRGLGRAIAERLAADGLTVGVLARTATEVGATAEAIVAAGGTARAFVTDVLDAPAIEKAICRFCDWAGRLDAVVCAAGRLQAIGPFELVDSGAWWLDFETSVRGTQQTIKACLPYLRASSQPSISVLVGLGHNSELAFASGYGSAQAALVRFVESLGAELKDEGLPVYAVYPGLVPTNLIHRLIDRPDGRRWLPQFNEAFSEGKEVGPDVVAEMVAWLASCRPPELNGRVVAAPLSSTILQTRLERVAGENLNVLRLR
ncbi:MAG TPA: SDR family oxidoreductase [Isosphaeraceae bacterium]|nr:SDR family oxidoreductase [Isosphaeraceae bacterium]